MAQQSKLDMGRDKKTARFHLVMMPFHRNWLDQQAEKRGISAAAVVLELINDAMKRERG